MSRKVRMSALFALLLSLLVGAVHAQEPRPTPTNEAADSGPQAQTDPEPRDGSIRGTIFEDRNGDGRCGGDDPVVAGIPIQFVSDDGRTTIFLQSGENGTYGLVAAGFGTWRVTADPPAPWVVTSQRTREAFLGSEQLLVLGVDFCLFNISTGTAPAPVPVVLPAAGAAGSGGGASTLLPMALVGFAFIVLGLGLEWRRRQAR